MSIYQQLHPSNGYHAIWTGKPGQCKRVKAEPGGPCPIGASGIHQDGRKCRGCEHHHCCRCGRCLRCERNQASREGA